MMRTCTLTLLQCSKHQNYEIRIPVNSLDFCRLHHMISVDASDMTNGSKVIHHFEKI